MVEWSEITHGDVAEHVHFLLVLVLCCQLSSTALERRSFAAADDAATVACSAVALCCLPATYSYTHVIIITALLGFYGSGKCTARIQTSTATWLFIISGPL